MSIQGISLRPIEAQGASGQGGGHYRVGIPFVLTGVLAANAPIFSIRWWNAAGMAFVLHKISVDLVQTVAFSTAQAVDVAFYKATGFSGSDTGGAAIAAAAITKKREVMPPSMITDMRAGALTAGTRVLKANPFSATGMWGAGIGAQNYGQGDFAYEIEREGPITCEGPVAASAEGIVANILTAFAATGSVNVYLRLAWSEVPIGSLLF